MTKIELKQKLREQLELFDSLVEDIQLTMISLQHLDEIEE